jgi:hypothetical protein
MKTELSLADLERRAVTKKLKAAKTTIKVMRSRLIIPSRGWMVKE